MMEGVTEIQSVMYDLVMKVTNEMKFEISTINETFDASKMIFATNAASKT